MPRTNFPHIPPFRPFIPPMSLPAVYGDELSYMELLGKVEKWLSDLVESNNLQNAAIVALYAAWEAFKNGGYTESFEEFLDQWFADNQEHIDELLTGQFADELAAIQETADGAVQTATEAEQAVSSKVNMPTGGTNGQVLSKAATATGTEWVDPVIVTDQQAETYITQWLNEHPEATTTVQDGAITTTKIADGAVTDAKLAPNGVVLQSDINSVNIASGLTAPNLFWYGTHDTIPATLSVPQIRILGNSISLDGTFANYEDLYIRVSGDNIHRDISLENAFTRGYNNLEHSFSMGHTYDILFSVSNNVAIPEGCYIELMVFYNSSTLNQYVTLNENTSKRIIAPSPNLKVVIHSHGNFDISAMLTVKITDISINKDIRQVCANIYSEDRLGFERSVGFSGYTNNIISSNVHNLTEYIPVSSGDVISFYENGYNGIENPYDANARKIAFFDSEKNWILTMQLTAITHPNIPVVTAPTDGFIRIQIRVSSYVEVYVSSFTKLYNTVNLICFAGQSNMAGRGIVTEAHPEDAPICEPYAGYEFRAISDPTKLYPLTKTLGVTENNPEGINDGNMKTGGIATSFCNAMYEHNGGVSTVCVSASQGGTSTNNWLNNGLLTDCINRIETARDWLVNNYYEILNVYMLWCQGESDGDNIHAGRETIEQYVANTNEIFSTVISHGVDKVLLIRIGNYNAESDTRYVPIIQAQTEIAKSHDDVIMVSCDFAGFREKGLMKDSFHYYQDGYNITGNATGINSAYYITSGKEPTMYDPENNNLYYAKSGV